MPKFRESKKEILPIEPTLGKHHNQRRFPVGVREALLRETEHIYWLYVNYFIQPWEYVLRSQRVERRMRRCGVMV